MSWAEEHAADILRRERELRDWDDAQRDRDAADEARHAGSDRGAHHVLSPRPARCGCGCEEVALDDVPPESGQPAAVLLAAHLARRSDPLTDGEEAAAQAADDRAVAELERGITRLDGPRSELRKAPLRNPDGSRLAGSAARNWIRSLPDPRYTEFRGEQWPG